MLDEAEGAAILPANHPKLAALYSARGVVYRLQGDYLRAEKYFRKALGLTERIVGPEHREVGAILVHLSEVLSHNGQKEEAKTMGARSSTILSRGEAKVSVWSLKPQER